MLQLNSVVGRCEHRFMGRFANGEGTDRNVLGSGCSGGPRRYSHTTNDTGTGRNLRQRGHDDHCGVRAWCFVARAPAQCHTFVYVLEGAVVMQVKGGKEVTLRPGQTFYES